MLKIQIKTEKRLSKYTIGSQAKDEKTELKLRQTESKLLNLCSAHFQSKLSPN